MNYNEFSSIGLALIDDPYNSRAKLDTGTQCNYECTFCYYIDQLDKVTPLNIIKDRAKKIRDFGIKEIDLSGGESSVHKDWFAILDYCKEIGFENISALTNGYKFASLDFLKKSQEHGLSELLFSLHGWDEESHEKIVKRKGAFERILKAIENAKALGIKVRINCTVTSYNAPHLMEYVKLIHKIMPFQLNFLPLNYWEDANSLRGENYEYLSAHIKQAIDQLDSKIEINVRYIPFCFMKGYEKYVVGIYQHIYDRGDWNIITYDVDSFEVRPVGVVDYFEQAKKQRLYTYSKSKECFECKYFFICDGVEKKIANDQKVYPESGDKIKDVQFYRRGNYPTCQG